MGFDTLEPYMWLIIFKGFSFGKIAVFPGGYGHIGEIPHGQLRPDWGVGTLKIDTATRPFF